MYSSGKGMFAGPVEKMRKKPEVGVGPVMRDKPTTGGPMPKFEMPGNRVAPGGNKNNKDMLRKQAISKRLGK